MKLLRLEISNITALADVHGSPQVIDFESAPLGDVHLLAITGPTGAGKSSILDALCLALYGKVPRLRGVSVSTSDSDGSTVNAGNSVTLLTRGRGRGHVVVDFLSHDGHRYRAVWQIRRARDRPTGKLQKIARSLVNLDTGVELANQIGEVDALITARIGLGFEQFSRSVLLAQSDFAAFLKASDNERAALLESLTDTGEYSRIGQLAFEQHKHARLQHEQLLGAVDAVQPLDDHDRAALDAALHDSQQALDAHQQAIYAQQALLRAWQVQQARRLEIDSAQADQTHWQAQQPAMQALHETVQRLERCAPLQEWLAQQQHAKHDLRQLNACIQTQQTQLDDLMQRQAQQQQTWQDARDTLAQAEHQEQQSAEAIRHTLTLESQRDALRDAYKTATKQRQTTQAALSKAQATLQTQDAACAAFAQTKQQHEDVLAQSADLSDLDGFAPQWLPDQLRQLLKQHADSFGDLRALEQTRQELHQRLHAQRQQHPHDWPEQLAAQLEQLGNQRQQLLDQQTHVQRACEQQRQFDELTAALAAQTSALDALLKQHHSALHALNDLTIQQQQRHMAAQLHTLRAQLHAGEPCLLCGSTEHPLVHAPVTTPALDDLEQALQTAQTQEAQMRRKIDQLSAQQQHTIEQQQRLAQSIDRDSLPDAATLQQALQRNQEDMAHVTEQQRQWRHQHTQQQHWHEQAMALDHRIERIKQRQQQQQALIDLLPAAWRTQWPALHQPMAPDTLRPLIASWQTSLTQRQQAHQALQDLHGQTANLHAQHQSTRLRIDDLTHALAQQQQHLDEQTQQGQRLSAAIAAHLPAGVDSAGAWAKQLESQRRQAREHEQIHAQTLARTRQQHDQLAHQQRSNLDRQMRLQHDIATLQQRIDAWIEQHGAPPADWHDWTEAKRHEALAQCSRHQQDGLAIDTRLTALLRLHSEHASAFPALACVNSEQELTDRLAVLNAKQDTLLATCIQLAAQRQQDDDAKKRLHHLQAQLDHTRTQLQRWSDINSLIGSADGDKFRRIAQQHQLDLLVHHANQQLQALFPRYQLRRLDDSLGLEVVDLDMGSERRSAYSLSGGESFLVSLALALGLAALACGSLHIESLFIDEGFGSLDAQTLNLAMDLLDRLQGQGRRVVVISHVSDMQERIPVQIQVQPSGDGLSRIHIHG